MIGGGLRSGRKTVSRTTGRVIIYNGENYRKRKRDVWNTSTGRSKGSSRL